MLAALVLCLPMAQARASEGYAFQEVWAYLMDGEEKLMSASFPVTDLAYFGAGLNSQGKLVGIPKREAIRDFKGRVHLVVAEGGNYALTHFCLSPDFPLRKELIADIASAAQAYDGVQVDFEAVATKDLDNYYDFISLLAKSLGGKRLSVALPACSVEASDRFGYARLAKVADRVIVMAYDEHWSSGLPGPVASIEWCRATAAYALSKVEPSRLVMGSPFYGRAWADKNPSRAYRYSGIESLFAEKGISLVQRQDGLPFVEYTETVKVKLYYDDRISILARMDMYRASKVSNIAFWRIGQEDPAVWEALTPRLDSSQGESH